MGNPVPVHAKSLTRLDYIEARLDALEGACGTSREALEATAGRSFLVMASSLGPATNAPQPVGDTEFPDADTPYSRAIALADLQSLAFTLHKRGEPNPFERMEFTAHELLNATKTGWTTWQETDDTDPADVKVFNVMMKADGMFNSANGWVEVLVKSRTDGPVVWLEITDGDWGTVTDIKVVHG